MIYPPEQQQALAVLRSKKVSIVDWMKMLRQYFAGLGKGDQASRTSLEGVLLRLEQRIGRCHRYGQKFDVVVVNFINRNNAADLRVYELLDEKFRLFNGVFGASDEVLGAVESGVDFEKRIATIYQKCRSQEQIQFEFDQLQKELETEIAEGQKDARENLLNNFDQEVVEKVRIQSRDTLDRFNQLLWQITGLSWLILPILTRAGSAFACCAILSQARISTPGHT